MAKLSDATIDSLLDHLAEDDGFRTRFQHNPREATRSLGTGDPGIDSLPDAPIPNLAPKEGFRKSRAVVRKQLRDAMGPFTPITLDIPR